MDFNKLREEIKAKPMVPKQWALEILTKAESHILTSLTTEGKVLNVGKVFKPQTIKKYDVISAMVGPTTHPCLVWKVENGKVYAFGMTTKDHILSVHTFQNSRFFKDSKITSTLVIKTEEEALLGFIGVFDAKKEANTAFKAIKEFYKSTFKF